MMVHPKGIGGTYFPVDAVAKQRKFNILIDSMSWMQPLPGRRAHGFCEDVNNERWELSFFALRLAVIK